MAAVKLNPPQSDAVVEVSDELQVESLKAAGWTTAKASKPAAKSGE